MSQWGLPTTIGIPYGGVFLVLMALTIMYLVVRFMRVASAEALGASIPVMRNVHVGSIIALLLTLFLIWVVPFLGIWVMFGASNQLMASLALLLITLWLMSKGKAYQWTFWPFVFMFVTTIAALIYKVVESIDKLVKGGLTGQQVTANIIIMLVAILLVVAALVLAWDGVKAILKFRAQPAAPAEAGGGE
jgi:carbon starvation protein